MSIPNAGAEEPLKIVYNTGVAPLKFEDASGQAAGLFPDIWRLWAEKTDQKIQIVKTETFAESLNLVKSGQADLHAGLFKTAEREQYLDYSKPILKLDYFLFTHPIVKTISDIKDTSGLIIGIQSGGYTEHWVRKRVPAERIKVYPSFTELFDAAIKGDIRVFVSTRISLLYYLSQHRMANFFSWDSQKPLFSQTYYTATAKEHKELIKAVDKGMAAIGPVEWEQLEDKWIVEQERTIPPEFAAILTDEERSFLVKTSKIRVHNEMDWAPLNFNIDGVPKGFSIDYMNLLGQKSGLSIEYVHGPTWNKFMEMIKSGELDVMLNIARSPEREDFLEFTPPYITMIHALYTRKNFPQVDSIQDLYGKRFAIPKGFYLQEILKKYPQVKVIEVSDTSAAIVAVSVGKADALFDLMPVVNYLQDQLQITNLKVGGDIGIKESKPIPLHIAVAKDRAILASILAKAMKTIPDKKISALHTKWLSSTGSKPSGATLTWEEEEWVAKRAEKVIIGAEMDWPPFDFTENGRPTGYANELVRLAAEKVGLPIEFVQGYSWAELMEKFKAGEIDVLPAVYFTPERKAFMAFTKVYAANPSVLVVNAERTDIKKMADLKGMNVAIVSGFATAEIMRERHPDIVQMAVKNVQDGLKAVSFKKADAFIGSLGVISHIMNTAVIPDIRIVGEAWLKTQEETELHMGVLKENAILRDILQKGLDAVTRIELQTLRQQWIPFAAAIIGKTGQIPLTPEERRWLRMHQTLRLGDDFSWAPFTFLDEENQFAGIASGYAEAISERLGVEFIPITGLSWNEIVDGLKAGDIDVTPAVARTPEREKFLNFTKPYISLPVVIVTRKDAQYVDELDDLAGMKVGVVKGYITHEILKKDYPTLVLAPFNSLADGLDAVDKGKIASFVDNLGSITYEIDRQKLKNIKIAAPTDYRFDLAFGVRKDWPQLVQIMDKALDTINEKERKAIKNTWMAIEVKYGLTPKQVVIWVAPLVIGAVLIILIIGFWNRRLGAEISERKAAELKIRAMSDASHDAVIMINGKGEVKFWNTAAEKMFGITAKEAMGTRMHSLFVPEAFRETAFKGIRHFEKTGQGPVVGTVIEHIAMRQNGDCFPVEIAVSSFKLGDGWYAVGSVRDITERKKTEQERDDAFEIITDSITYAANIQSSLLPVPEMMEKALGNYFIVWDPRDRVGGDIYLMKPWGLAKAFVLGDCTGHGVPGAFMTMIANGALEEAVLETPPGDCAVLLQRMHQLIQKTLKQDKDIGDSDDGMELGICFIHPRKKTMVFSGAQLSLFYVEDGQVAEVKGDKSGIGYRHVPYDRTFTNHEVGIGETRTFYMTSDGIVDQIGGPKRRGFGKKRFKALLLDMEPMQMDQRPQYLRQALNNWQDAEKRRDDVSVVGFRFAARK